MHIMATPETGINTRSRRALSISSTQPRVSSSPGTPRIVTVQPSSPRMSRTRPKQPIPSIQQTRLVRNGRDLLQPTTTNGMNGTTCSQPVPSSVPIQSVQPAVGASFPAPISQPMPRTSTAPQEPHGLQETLDCPICTITVTDDSYALLCEQCGAWHHSECLYIPDDVYLNLSRSPEPWFCDHCSSIRANKLKWGSLEGELNIRTAVKAAYRQVITWKKNIFHLPRGKSGTEFLKELTRLLYLFVDKTKWECISLPLVHIFVPIMLQKPSKKSKAKDHAKYLASRLEKWSNGELDELLNECQEIQRRMAKSKAKREETKQRKFCKLMLLGKVGPACKLINNNDSVTGVHKLTAVIKQALADKHPKAEEMHSEVLLPVTRPTPNPVIFEQLTAEVIQTSSKNLNGSGGPTLVDTDSWKYFLCSKSYGRHPYHLAEAICGLAKRLCIENIHPDSL